MITCVLWIDSLPGQRMDLAAVPRVGERVTMHINGQQYRLAVDWIDHSIVPDSFEPGAVNQEVWIYLRSIP